MLGYKSKVFYEALGFRVRPECGSIADKWLVLRKDTTMIGLFEGMFAVNILTFTSTDVRAIEKHPIFRIFFGIPIIFLQIQSGQSTDASGLAAKIVLTKCQERQTCRFNSTAYF
jgi:hypothetical protein